MTDNILLCLIAACNIATTVVVIFIALRNRSGRTNELLAQTLATATDTKDALQKEMALNRDETAKLTAGNREEMRVAMRDMGDSLLQHLNQSSGHQRDQLTSFQEQLTSITGTTVRQMERLNETIDGQMKGIREDSSKKLEDIRRTVDEKLHETLERRLGESFQVVTRQLEQVHKGLGEMQTLASGVSDLKKVLSNVKSRGILGEVQLGNLLEQMLTKDQYETNVATRPGSSDRVEFAIKLPGKDCDTPVWLPIDAKFPQEDYIRLQDAYDTGNAACIEEASKQLEKTIVAMAKLIRDKYIEPPHTTDFGIMFLPTEGLYAEALRRQGLFETLNRDYKITLAGPVNLSAFLNSLQMGFRTLAIEKRSSEVWAVLGGVKSEFRNFGLLMDKTKKKLQEASNTIDAVGTRTRAIEKRLRDVQELPTEEPVALLEQPMDLTELEELPTA